MAATILSIIAIVCCYICTVIGAVRWYLELDRYIRRMHATSSVVWCLAGTLQLLALLLK